MNKVCSLLETKILIRLWPYTGFSTITPQHGHYRLESPLPGAEELQIQAKSFLCRRAFLKHATFRISRGMIVGVQEFELTVAGKRFYNTWILDPFACILKPPLLPLIEEAILTVPGF